MKELLRALNPMRNPVWQAYERLNNRRLDVAMRDPFFLAAAGNGLKAGLSVLRMQEQWMQLWLGGVPGAVTHTQVENLWNRLTGLEERLNQVAQAPAQDTPQ